jgi:hypothetical protein
MEWSVLRTVTGMRYTMLIPLLGELAKEGRITMHGDLVSLISE